MTLLPTFPRALVLVTAVTLVACGPGGVEDPTSGPEPNADLPADEDDHTSDDFHCGELGLKCVGGLGLGECIDGECTPSPGGQCWSPEFAPTCDAYCEAFDRTCAYLGCEGATAYGWTGTQHMADRACGTWSTAVPMTVTCDQPLDGLITTLLCCCNPASPAP
jgi:hypothetical protein